MHLQKPRIAPGLPCIPRSFRRALWHGNSILPQSVVPTRRDGHESVLVPRPYRSSWVSVIGLVGFTPLTCLHSAFGGLIAFGVGHIHTSTPAWKWLFVIEALPCFALGLVCLWWLPDRPLKNSRFSGQHQEIAVARYYSEEHDAGDFQWRHIIWVLTDWRLYGQVAVYAPTGALLSSVSGFLPSIVSGELSTVPSNKADILRLGLQNANVSQSDDSPHLRVRLCPHDDYLVPL